MSMNERRQNIMSRRKGNVVLKETVEFVIELTGEDSYCVVIKRIKHGSKINETSEMALTDGNLTLEEAKKFINNLYESGYSVSERMKKKHRFKPRCKQCKTILDNSNTSCMSMAERVCQTCHTEKENGRW